MHYLFLVGALLSPLVLAHPFDMALVQARFEGKTVRASLDLNPAIVALVLGVPPAEMTPAVVAGASGKLMRLTLGGGPLEYGGGPCEWSGEGLELPNPNTVRISGVARCPGEGKTVSWKFPFLRRPGIPSVFHVLLKANFGAEERVQTGEAGNDKIAFELEGVKRGWIASLKSMLGL